MGVLDAVLPPHCLTCDAEVDQQGALCAACFGTLSFVTTPLCARCGVPFRMPGPARPRRGPLCPGRLARPPATPRPGRRCAMMPGRSALILPFKHADRTELAGPLARHMARAGAALLARAEVVAPVPLHWRRLLARRYNQAALLSARLARGAGRPHLPDLLRRRRATPPLGEMGAAERAAALEGVFTLLPPRRRPIAGRGCCWWMTC